MPINVYIEEILISNIDSIYVRMLVRKYIENWSKNDVLRDACMRALVKY